MKISTLSESANHFRKRDYPGSFINFSQKKKNLEFLQKYFLDDSILIIKQGDLICEHVFDLLGSGPVKVRYGMKAKGFEGHCYDMKINSNKAHSSSIVAQKRTPAAINYEPIDWHIDFKSGHRWNPKTYYKRIKYGHRAGVDVKIPWELSRFQHLTTLGEAYFLSKNEKYVKEFVNQISDWIEHNPPKLGVNWVCTMDVAIRACNWLLAWEFFKDSPLVTNEFVIRFFENLLEHGRHIRDNLEYYEALTSNHYLSDIVGLVYLGVLIPEFKESGKWKNFGVEELKKEMKKQVYPDGVDFEASTCYHRLVLELFFYATLLVIINDKNSKEDNFMEVGNEIFGGKYIQHLYKMFEFVLYALKPNGRMPQIGDNDNGRLHIFVKREVLDMRYLLTLGAIFFKEPKFKVKEFGFCEEVLWVFGEKGYRIWQDLEENCLARINSQAFLDAGCYIMRNDKNYCIISCGPNGQNGNGGHCHNDKLSLELCVEEVTFMVDPGTYVYTPCAEMRNLFRSSAYHNTVVVDGREQNRFRENELFRMRTNMNIRMNKWKVGREYDFFSGEYQGYKRGKRRIIHKREIYFDKKDNYWITKDILEGKGLHQADLYFHITPLEVELDKEFSLAVKIRGERVNLAIIPVEEEGISVKVLEGWISPYYGVKMSAPVVKYSKKGYLPFAFCNVVCPYREEIKIKGVLKKVKSMNLEVLKR